MSKRSTKKDHYIDLDDEEEEEDPLAVKLSFHSQLSRHSQSVLPGLADLMMDPDMLDEEDAMGGGASDDEDMIPKKKKPEEDEDMLEEEFEEVEVERKPGENPEEEAKESASSNGTMFDYENSDSSAEPGQDSPQTPMSNKYSQDEEFTDPEDPVTVIKTALQIDAITEKEELERKIKEREKE